MNKGHCSFGKFLRGITGQFITVSIYSRYHLKVMSCIHALVHKTQIACITPIGLTRRMGFIWLVVLFRGGSLFCLLLHPCLIWMNDMKRDAIFYPSFLCKSFLTKSFIHSFLQLHFLLSFPQFSFDVCILPFLPTYSDIPNVSLPIFYLLYFFLTWIPFLINSIIHSFLQLHFSLSVMKSDSILSSFRSYKLSIWINL